MTAQEEKREVGNLITEGIPEIPPKLNEKLQQYQNTREADVAGWLTKGEGLVIYTRFGESTQLHLINRIGSQRKQLTFFSEPVFGASICPAGDRNTVVFLKDIGGDELYQLYHFDIDSGDCRLLSDGCSRNEHGIWNHRGDALVYGSTRRNNVDYDIYLNFPDRPENNRCLLSRDGYWFPVRWSPDDTWITVGCYRSVAESYLYRLNIHTGELIPVSPSGRKTACRGGYWSGDGKGIFYTSDEESQFRKLVYVTLETGCRKILTPDINWDVEAISLSPDFRKLAFTTNENGLSRLHLMDAGNFTYAPVDSLPMGQVGGLKWHADSRRMALTINTPVAPSDVYVLNTVSLDLERWTFSEVGGLPPEQFIAPSLIHYPTFDRAHGKSREIPAYYYRPRRSDQPLPVLIYIHGGPESQYRPDFSPIFQYYLNELGIAVIAPNVRGSTGYGKRFLKLDDGYKREDSVHDIGKLLDWIETQPELDHRRIAVMGGSYGGYMVLASMTHYNERLTCGVDVVGISNFVTFLKNTKSYRRNLRRVEYGDERDPKMRRHLEQISPTTNAHKITKPMLIVQGLNDPRVPASEAEQMLQAIRKNGGEAWYLLAKDEGHGFRKKSNRDYFNKAVILFLQRYLLGQGR